MLDALTKLFAPAPTGKIDALARQVAELSVENVCQLVSAQVEAMSFSEARGYVRARARRVVRRHTALAITRQPGAEPSWADAIVGLAVERLVPVVLRQTGVGVPKMAAPIRLAA